MAADDQSASGGAAETDTPLMFPLMLNITDVSIMLVGGTELAVRLAMLDEHGAQDVHVFAGAVVGDLKRAAGVRLSERWPQSEDYDRIRPQLVFVANVDDELAVDIRSQARRVGALVHVQDRIPLCDFHLPARVRRGHLQITVSTDGTVAGLSRLIRESLERDVFGPEWAGRVDELAAARRKWKQDGSSFDALGRAVRDFVVERGWLKWP